MAVAPLIKPRRKQYLRRLPTVLATTPTSGALTDDPSTDADLVRESAFAILNKQRHHVDLVREELQLRAANLHAYEDRLLQMRLLIQQARGARPAPTGAAPLIHEPALAHEALNPARERLKRAQEILEAEQAHLRDERLAFRDAALAVQAREAAIATRERELRQREAALDDAEQAFAEAPPSRELHLGVVQLVMRATHLS